MAVKVLFGGPRYKQLAELPGVYTDNPENYFRDPADQKRLKLRTDRKPLPSMVPIFKGMRLYLTANKDKDNDFVNGMAAVIEAFDEKSKCLTVKTVTGKRLALHPCTEDVESAGRVTSYPARVGYAGTIQRIQGMTLEHVTLYLDRPGCRAAGVLRSR